MSVGCHIVQAGTCTSFDVDDQDGNWIAAATAAVADVFTNSLAVVTGGGRFHAAADVLDLEINTVDPTTEIIVVTMVAVCYRGDG